jgi:gliding motility-associated-like protein
MINLPSYIKDKFPLQLLIILSAVRVLFDHGSVLKAEDLRGFPTSIVFREIEGNASAAQRSIFLFTTTDGTVMNWTVSKNASWITTDLTAGVTEGVLKVGVNTTSLMHGVYTGNVVIQSAQSTADPVVVGVTLIINPDVPVKVTTWKGGYPAAMSVSIDSRPSAFTVLQTYGFKGTYFLQDEPAPSYLTDYYNAGMEVGSHTINHPCAAVSDDRMKYTEIEPNVLAICTGTPEPCKDVISFAWPCGFTNYREESDAALYFLSARGYNFNKLEDATPENFMNLKSYNSHEHDPEPPADLRTVVDTAIMQKKWFNLVQHVDNETLPVDIAYAATQNIWVANIGTVVKYILQRDRVILTDYLVTPASISFKVSRLAIPSTVSKTFEQAFGQYDIVTMEIDIDNSKAIENVYVNGIVNPYVVKNISGNLVLQTDLKPETSTVKTVEVRYIATGTGLTVSGITASNKLYDGTQTAVLNTSGAILVGVQAGDNVSLVTTGAIGSFTNKNVGTDKTVVTSGFTLTGADAGKYALTQPSTSANITPANLTITGVSASSKVYDRTTTATLNTGSAAVSGVLSGDFVTLSKTNAAGTFANKNVGTNKTVTVSGFALSGVDAGNYIFAQPSLNASITAVNLTISGVTANDKIYDGTTTATLNTGSAALVGILSGDVVNLVTSGATGNFVNAFSGTGKTVNTSGFTLSGSDSGNYTLTQPATTASIIGINLTVTGVTANNKVYDGNTTATLNTGSAALSGVMGSDAVTLVRTGATGTFNNKNAGTSKTVTISGFTISGADAGKYSLTQPTATANITSAIITISGVTVNNKVYDGTATAVLNTGTAALAGVISGDVVTLVTTGATGSFNNKSAGTAKTVTITGFTINGTDSGNYTLTQPSAAANITAASLSVSGVTVSNKVYNASTGAVINTSGAILNGVISGDIVSLVSSGASGSFANKNAGTGKTVLITGFALNGADASNYLLNQPSLTADITPVPLTVSGITANNKAYNGNTIATLNGAGATLTGVVSGDIVTVVLTGATGTFANKNTGTGKAVTIAGVTLGGTDGGNYTLTQPSATASITVAPLNISGVIASNKTYDGTGIATLNTGGASLAVIYGSDAVTLSSVNASGTFSDKNTGTGKTVTTSGFTISGADAYNYNLLQPVLTASILARTLTVTANDLFKSYKTTLTFTGTEYTYTGLVAGDILPAFTISSTGAPLSAPVGEYPIIVSGGSMPNYNIVYVNGILSVGKHVITARADDKSRTYGSENPVLTITYSGFMNSDDASVLDVPPSASTAAITTSVPGKYPIILSGGSDDTYAIKLEDGSLDVVKAPLTITADNKSKIHDQANPELTISYSGFVLGQNESVLDALPLAESDVVENSDAGDYKITVSGAADIDYEIIYVDGTFTVNKADQIIYFDEIPASMRMTQEVVLNASSSSGYPVEFKLSDPHKGSLSGNILTLNADGKLTVTAVQEGDKNHNPAPEVSQTIDVLPTFDNISSLFTPNADGMNDYWYIPDLDDYGSVRVTVYNRFGQAVYESDSYKNDWDGTWNGKPLPSAAYYYIIKSSTKGFIKGVVNIVR